MYFLFAIINFVLFVGAMAFFARKPLLAFWLARHNDIKGSVENAHQLFVKARNELSKWESALSRCQLECSNIRDALKRRGQNESSKMVSLAREYDAQLKLDIKAAMEFETAVAAKEVKKTTITEAIEIVINEVQKLPPTRKSTIAERSGKEITKAL